MATPFSSGQRKHDPLSIIRKYTPISATQHDQRPALTQRAAPDRHEAKRHRSALAHGSPSSLDAGRETNATAYATESRHLPQKRPASPTLAERNTQQTARPLRSAVYCCAE